MDGPLGSGLFLKRGGTLKWELGTSSGVGDGLTLYNHNAGAEAARFDNSGRFMIGTNSAPDGATLGVLNTGNSVTFKAHSSNSGFTSYMMFCEQQNASPTAFNFFYGRAGVADKIFIRGDGNIYNANNSYGAISMRSRKFDFAPAGSQWDDVKRLGQAAEKYYLYDDFLRAGEKAPRQLGLVTDKVKAVCPGLVSRDGDGNESIAYSVAYMKALVATAELLAWADEAVKPVLDDAGRRLAAIEQRLAAIEQRLADAGL
jgi:hypothetical protein